MTDSKTVVEDLAAVDECGCPDGPESIDEVLRRWPRECRTHGTEWSPDPLVERQGVEG